MNTDEQQMSNLDRYKKDLESLILTGEQLELSLCAKYLPEQFEAVKKQLDAKARKTLAALPPFATTYQRWYSEAKALIKLLLPDRLKRFS